MRKTVSVGASEHVVRHLLNIHRARNDCMCTGGSPSGCTEVRNNLYDSVTAHQRRRLP